VTLSEALAPIVPFLTEAIYQNLVRSAFPDAPESVHHRPYPTYDESLHDEALAREMDATLKIVSLALAARESESLRVRQPLAELIVVPANDAHRRAVERFGDHIVDELNVKQLTLGEDSACFLSVSVKPNFKLLGPKYGKSMRDIAAALATTDPVSVCDALARGEKVVVEKGDDRWELEGDEVIADRRAAEGYAVSEEKGLVVALDAEVTPQLEREGLARDLIRHIQQMRKELDLQVTDRIAITYATDAEKMIAAVTDFGERIAGETLADTLDKGEATDGKKVEILGHVLRLDVTKA
ncbi:MAG: DUF5915 domain-containing protein, partial [Acidobacteriota bacterium]